MNNSIEYNPKVFISYCQQNEAFSNMVLNFSNKLRAEEIDTELDQYITSPHEGWPRWMDNRIAESDYVIMVCTEEYNNRVIGKTKAGTGRGVKWEGNIIYQHLYNSDSLNSKFIPVVFTKEDINYIPTPIQGATHYNIGNLSEYNALYWRLREINPKEKPDLGKLRSLPAKERKSLYVTSLIDVETWDKAIWRGAAFMLDPNNIEPPCFMLPFKEEKYARKIFEDWINILGKDDYNEELRIAIIEGHIEGEEDGYSIHIGTNFDSLIQRYKELGNLLEEDLFMTVSRIHRANPTDNFKMFNLFKQQYKIHNHYILMPCIVDESSLRIKPLFDFGILKRELIFRNVSDIDEYDQDSVVIKKNKPWKKYND